MFDLTDVLGGQDELTIVLEDVLLQFGADRLFLALQLIDCLPDSGDVLVAEDLERKVTTIKVSREKISGSLGGISAIKKGKALLLCLLLLFQFLSLIHLLQHRSVEGLTGFERFERFGETLHGFLEGRCRLGCLLGLRFGS